MRNIAISKVHFKLSSVVTVLSSLLMMSCAPLVSAFESETSSQVNQVNLCDPAVEDAILRIQDGQDLPVNVRVFAISDSVGNAGRPESSSARLILTMGGVELENTQRIANIMSSPVFRNAIASELIDACDGLGVVTFGVYGTDWHEEHGSVYGVIQEFRCVPLERGRSTRIPWGVRPCN